MPEIVSRVYRPDPQMCCEACCFGRGEHSQWCDKAQLRTTWERWRDRFMPAEKYPLAHCRRCSGTGVIDVRHGTIFETDSADEIALAFHSEPCPACRPNVKQAVTKRD